MIEFDTVQDRTPADDGSRMAVVWHRRPGARHAHAYPERLVASETVRGYRLLSRTGRPAAGSGEEAS